jgi:hypothetical protein
MERRAHKRKRAGLRWWHHATIVGALGVGALYLVAHLYSGRLLFYAGPGDPYWIDEIFATWQIVFGTLLGMGVGVWIPKTSKPSRHAKRESSRRPAAGAAETVAGR